MFVAARCRRALVALCCRALVALSTLSAGAAMADVREPRMGIFTKSGARVDLALPFTDSAGNTAPLKELTVPGRPFILVPIFYRCPRLCGMTVSGVVDLVNHLPLTLGDQYSVVMYSFNPDDTTGDAAEKRERTVHRIDKQPVSAEAVRFLTAKAEVISAMNDALGFRVRFADKELEHSSAIFIVGPDGTVARYFGGVEFSPSKVAATLRETTPR